MAAPVAFTSTPARRRAGLMLALMRALVAALFAGWLWIAPPHALLGQPTTQMLFGSYALFALVMVAVAWRSWWYEFRLATPAFLVDAITLLAGLLFTEAIAYDFFSTFLAFFAFLMVTSVARWSRRRAMVVAVVLTAGFFASGLAVEWAGLPLDTVRFGRRLATVALLSVLLGWFAFDRRARSVPRFTPGDGADGGLLEAALGHAMAIAGAGRGALAWLAADESVPSLCHRELPAGTTLQPAAENRLPVLFDTPRRRAIVLDAGGGRRAIAGDAEALADLPASEAGLAIPIVARTGRGMLVLTDIAGLDADDLWFAEALGADLATAIDDAGMAALTREVALSRLREEIAADLHDTVVQTLAGARYRLEALRQGEGGQGGLPDDDIAALCTSMAGEQDNVRAMIARLRLGRLGSGRRDLTQALVACAQQVSQYWGIAISVADPGRIVALPPATIHGVQQILREATANAVRHGGASRLDVALRVERDGIAIDFVDNGRGFPGAGPHALPGSIARRAAALGARLTLDTRPGQTRLEMTLPNEPTSEPRPDAPVGRPA